MSHVDEGALHAYLDGALDEYPAPEAERIRAHLDACAECAARLEEERRVRGDAHAILALASPDVELPGLEELKAYVQRTRPAPSPASMRLWRMGWAASVVLALGTGWMMRGQAGGAGGAASSLPATEDFAASGRASGGNPVASAEPDASGGGSLVVPAVTEAEVRGDFADRQVAKMDAASAENEAAADFDAVFAPASAPAVVAEAPTEVPPPAPAERVVDRAADLDAAAATEVVALSVAPVAQAGAGAPAAERREETAARRTESLSAVTSSMERSAAPARALAADDRIIDPSVPSLVVPGLEVVSVTNLGLGTTPNGVHVVQRLADGSLVDIWHLEPDVERAVLPSLLPGVEEVAELTGNGWIVLRGETTRDELAGLLEFLRPGER